MNINVNVNAAQLTQQLTRLINEAPATFGVAVAESAEYIAGQAKALTPVDTSNLKNSINVKYKNSGMTAEIGTPVEYAPHVEFGTRPHKITSNRGLSDGTTFFGKEVNHPGTPAQPFLFPAWESGRNIFINNIRDAARNL